MNEENLIKLQRQSKQELYHAALIKNIEIKENDEVIKTGDRDTRIIDSSQELWTNIESMIAKLILPLNMDSVIWIPSYPIKIWENLDKYLIVLRFYAIKTAWKPSKDS